MFRALAVSSCFALTGCMLPSAAFGGLMIAGTVAPEFGSCELVVTHASAPQRALSTIRISGSFRESFTPPPSPFAENYRVLVACGGIVRRSATVQPSRDSLEFGTIEASPPKLTQSEMSALSGIPVLIFDSLSGLRYSMHLYENGYFGIVFLEFNDSELMDFWNQSFESAMIALLGVKPAAGCRGTESRAKIHQRDQTSALHTQGVALHEATAMRNLGCRVAAYLNSRFQRTALSAAAEPERCFHARGDPVYRCPAR